MSQWKNVHLKPRIDVDALIGAVKGVVKDTDVILKPLDLGSVDVLNGTPFIKYGRELEQRLQGVQMLASYLRGCGDLVTSSALFAALAELLLAEPLSTELGMMTANVVEACASTSVDSGTHRLVAQRASAWAEGLTRLGQVHVVITVKLFEAEALIVDGYYEGARHILDALSEDEIPGDLKPIRHRLADKLEALLKASDEKVPEAPDLAGVIAWHLEWLKGTTGFSPEQIKQIDNILSNSEPFKLVQSDSFRTSVSSLGFPVSLPDSPALEAAVGQLHHTLTPRHQLAAVMERAGSILQTLDDQTALICKGLNN